MKIHKYKDYNEYVQCQKKANERKFDKCWCVEKNIEAISEYLKSKIENIENGICHGVRQGHEVLWFNKFLNCVVIGTDIGKAEKEYVIQHDFNKQKKEWIGKFDFVYSNSFDHAFNPEKTFNIWFDQLKTGGFVILEYDRRQEHTGEISMSVNKTDPVSIRFKELEKLINKWNNDAVVWDVLEMPIITQQWRKAMIIKKADNDK